MIWFNLKELERRLRNGELSDKYIFNYLLASVLLESVVSYVNNDEYTTKWILGIEIIILLLITGLSMKKTFDINAASDNKDYFIRYLSLSFVIGIRLFVFIFIAVLPTGFIVNLVDKDIRDNEIVKDLFDLVVAASICIFYYFMLINSFRRVSQVSDSNQ